MHTKQEVYGHKSNFLLSKTTMTRAFVAVHCEVGKEGQVIRKLMETKGISEVTGVLGLYDIIVKVEAQDSSTLEQIVTKQIRKIPNVLTTMTLIVI